jgi:RNA polymerase sigma factor (sigma-70 family)
MSNSGTGSLGTNIDAGRAEMSTTDVLRAATAGNRLAWEELISRYRGLVRSTIASFRFRESDAADAEQNTWVRLLESAPAIRDPEKLGGWLATTASRECLAQLRRSRREVASETLDLEPTLPSRTPEAVVITDETHRAVRAAVAGLGGRRGVLINALFFQPELSYAQIAHETGTPIGSIGPIRGRVLQRLRRALRDWESSA